MATDTFAPQPQQYDSQSPVSFSTSPNSRYRREDSLYPLPSLPPSQAASYEGYNEAQIPPFSTQDSGHSRHVHTSYPSDGSPPRQRSVSSNPLYTSHPQPERSDRPSYSQPQWQQQHSSPPRSADPRYPGFDHTSASSRPTMPQYTSSQGSYTSPSQPVAHYSAERSTHQYIGTHSIPPNYESTPARNYNVSGEGNPLPGTWRHTSQSVPAVLSAFLMHVAKVYSRARALTDTSTPSSSLAVGRM